MLTKKEIEKRHREKREKMTTEEYFRGLENLSEQTTPRGILLAKWEFKGTGTPVEVLEYELNDAKKVKRKYYFALLLTVAVSLIYTFTSVGERLDLPDWVFVLVIVFTAVILTVNIFMDSSIDDIHYALEAEKEIEQLKKEIEAGGK